jgi:glycosyltransferase involved in cell wall biosynthesis
MKIILLEHPPFFGSTSMIHYSRMNCDGMKARGHEVETWTPVPRLRLLPVPAAMKKWLGYIDQFLVFPLELLIRASRKPADVLFVLPDQALGMWMPMIMGRPHAIHCHDLLALRSARGEWKENPVRWTGRIYQELIRSGFSTGRWFLSVSAATRRDLHRFLNKAPQLSEVIYNGLNHDYRQMDKEDLALHLPELAGQVEGGYLLHVGAAVWYKNRIGAIEIYGEWLRRSGGNLPLVMIGNPPDETLQAAVDALPASGKVHFVTGVSSEALNAAYSNAKTLLFPSLAEGFGWPILEAMASGTTVVTTGEEPMTEIARDIGWHLPRKQSDNPDWASECAEILRSCIDEPEEARQQRVTRGIARSKEFSTSDAIGQYEAFYQKVLSDHRAAL